MTTLKQTKAMNTVYSLSNPLNNNVYYVGFTTKGVIERLRWHLAVNPLPTTKFLLGKGYTPVIDILEQGDNVTIDNEKKWIQKLHNQGVVLENKDGLINYQDRGNLEFTDDEIRYLSSLSVEERYKTVIKRVLHELPLDSSIPIVIRIKNFCETSLSL